MRTIDEVYDVLDESDLKFKRRLYESLKANGHMFTLDEIGRLVEVDEADLVVDEDVPEQDPTTIKISDLVNDNFYQLFSPSNPIKQPYRIFKGGRSSFKSSAISVKLVYDFIQDDRANTICFRKVAKYLSTSVYEQIKWAIIQLNIQDQFTFLKSPLKIIHNSTNTAFYFYGVDDPLKIKSAKIAEGYVKDLWYEEAAEFESKEEIDTVNDTFIRQELPADMQTNIYYSYNPPRNPYNWINIWLEELEAEGNNKDYYIHHSTYEEDKKGFLSKQFVEKVERIRHTDKDYHDWMYRGLVTGLGNTIYNYKLFNVIDQVPSDDRLILADITIDPGHSASASTYLFIGYTLKRRIIILDTYYYSPANKISKKAPSELSKDLWTFSQDNVKQYNLPIDTWTIDSADGALSNQFMKDYGIVLTPARKGKKIQMVENVRDLLALKRIDVLDTPNNQIFLEEHKMYRWNEKSLEPGKDPEVLKIDDHTCDAFQYYVANNASKLELRV